MIEAGQGGAPNGVLLVAKPDMADPRFRETVVLVTQTPDGHTVGVILNRPLEASLSDYLRHPRAGEYAGVLGYGASGIANQGINERRGGFLQLLAAVSSALHNGKSSRKCYDNTSKSICIDR